MHRYRSLSLHPEAVKRDSGGYYPALCSHLAGVVWRGSAVDSQDEAIRVAQLELTSRHLLLMLRSELREQAKREARW